MKMGKNLAAILAMSLTMSVTLVGCGGNSGSSTSSDGSSSPASGAETAKTSDEPITIVYGGWESPLMIREMGDRFTKLHPNIKIEVFNNGKWLGNDEMSKLAATNSMPDIINLQDIVIPTQNDWVVDMKPYLDKDPDAANLPQNFVKYGTVNNRQIMLPSAIYAYGVMMNLDILSANGITPPAYNWTVDEFADIAKKTTKKGETVGANDPQAIMHHIPAQMNPDFGWGSFNEKTRQFELGANWEYAVNIAKELNAADCALFGKTWQEIGDPGKFEEGSAEKNAVIEKQQAYGMEKIGESEPYTAWAVGKETMCLDFTWALGFPKQENYSGFEWDFYPMPIAGDAKEPRTAMVIDSIGITSTCENPEAAFEFVKFLTYGAEGIEAKMDACSTYDKAALQAKYPDLDEKEFANPLTYVTMPATTDKELINKWADFNDAKPGLRYVLDRMDGCYADGYKVTPGYEGAYSLNIEKTVREQVFTGQKVAADIGKELQDKANKIVEEAYAALEQQ